MPFYYAVIPGYEKWSAEVDARDKRKARTAYLDLLVRRLKVIPYAMRQQVRELVVVERIEPGAAYVNYRIAYDGSSESITHPLPGSGEQYVPSTAFAAEGSIPVAPVAEVQPPAEQTEVVERLYGETRAPQVPISRVPPIADSPVMNISRHSGGS